MSNAGQRLSAVRETIASRQPRLATGIAPVLSPIAGLGLAALMIGAVITHVRRHESFLIPLVLGILSIAAATLGFLVQA